MSQELFGYLRGELSKVAADFGERLLHTPNNPISLGTRFSAGNHGLLASNVPGGHRNKPE